MKLWAALIHVQTRRTCQTAARVHRHVLHCQDRTELGVVPPPVQVLEARSGVRVNTAGDDGFLQIAARCAALLTALPRGLWAEEHACVVPLLNLLNLTCQVLSHQCSRVSGAGKLWAMASLSAAASGNDSCMGALAPADPT